MCDRIVRVSDLAEFTAEVRKELPLRLSFLERNIPKNSIPSREIELHLQGHNDLGEVVWLMESHRIIVFPSGPETPRDRSIYEGMRELHRLVQEHLAAQGYEIRSGIYGVSDTIKPLSGRFEIVRWQKTDDDPDAWTVVPLDPGVKEN
jgi:hypothetical protein